MQTEIDAVEAVARIEVVPGILETCCRVTGMGFAAVARVTDQRWIACSVRDEIAFGLQAGGELKLETTICHEIRQSGQAVIIADVARDPVFCRHDTPAQYGFRSYISVPIVLPDGRFFGTLCAIDPNPADLNRPEVRSMFRMFADLLGFHLDASERLTLSQSTLASERAAGELREQFIAVLGHDLRNPLAALQAGTNLLSKRPSEDRVTLVLGQMQASIDRMGGLISNVLDFARGRMGGGLTLTRTQIDVTVLQSQVVDELALSHPGRQIASKCDVESPVNCDSVRLAQLLSNLLGNALTHGAVDGPITVRSWMEGQDFLLSVSNAGEEIPPAARAQLFQPFSRGHVGDNRDGLGIGLYIASEIARAHGGDLSVESFPTETRFTLRMPPE